MRVVCPTCAELVLIFDGHVAWHMGDTRIRCPGSLRRVPRLDREDFGSPAPRAEHSP